MERKEVVELMKEIYTTREAAEYLNISIQRLNQLVHDKRIEPVKASKSVLLFLKSDLDQREIVNISNTVSKETFNVNTEFVRDAILYFTIQQYFNNSDKKTCAFIEQIKEVHNFNFRSGLKNNIPVLAKLLKIDDKSFYNTYTMVKNSFKNLDNDVKIIKRGDLDYPKLLAETVDAPPYLFLKGNTDLLHEKSVCVVGSRNATADSMKKTERLVESLVKRNLVVNAGLAKGIDTATHSAALKCKGKTIAVIGTPINQYYPKENKELQLRIEKEGLVVSQFPPCNQTLNWHFPMRNATMSGISLATIIMEAGETSGALKQADYALKQGRKVLIPQSALNNRIIQWPKKYIEKGANSFATLKEVLQQLNKIDIIKNAFDDTDMEELKNVEMD